jgi:hypothetical protein
MGTPLPGHVGGLRCFTLPGVLCGVSGGAINPITRLPSEPLELGFQSVGRGLAPGQLHNEDRTVFEFNVGVFRQNLPVSSATLDFQAILRVRDPFGAPDPRSGNNSAY